jgi:hypothetical protein
MMVIKAVAARNLPIIIFSEDTGIVKRSSYEPVLNSSEKSRIVMAGMIKENIIGRSEKKLLSSAWSKRKKVEKKNHPVNIRKIEITIYAIGETK